MAGSPRFASRLVSCRFREFSCSAPAAHSRVGLRWSAHVETDRQRIRAVIVGRNHRERNAARRVRRTDDFAGGRVAMHPRRGRTNAKRGGGVGCRDLVAIPNSAKNAWRCRVGGCLRRAGVRKKLLDLSKGGMLGKNNALEVVLDPARDPGADKPRPVCRLLRSGQVFPIGEDTGGASLTPTPRDLSRKGAA